MTVSLSDPSYFRQFVVLTLGSSIPIRTTEMLSTFTYKLAFSSYEFSHASASAFIVLLLSMFVAFFYVKQQRASDE
jgi:ABC-type sugar transport system permease subunit